MTEIPPRRVLWLTLGTLVTTLFGITQYHGAIAAGQYVSRPEMAALASEVLLGTATVAAALLAAAKRRPWITPGPITYGAQRSVNASVAAFMLGMFAYLVIYPPTAWVFDTVAALGFALGVMITMPLEQAGLPTALEILNAGAGAAACAAGFVLGSGLLVIVGLFVGVWALAGLTATSG